MTQEVLIFVYLTGGSETKYYFAVLQPEKGEASEDRGSRPVVPLILWSSGVDFLCSLRLKGPKTQIQSIYSFKNSSQCFFFDLILFTVKNFTVVC